MIRLVPLLWFSLAATGCIKEDRSGCQTAHIFIVRAYDRTGTELSRNEVGDVALFVFDSSLRFVERIDTHVGERITIPAGGRSGIHIVGWGNLGGGSQNCPMFSPGDLKEGCCIDLMPNMHAADEVFSPDDLFRGEITIDENDPDAQRELPIYREVGSMSITVRNLKTPGRTLPDTDYSIMVRETYSGIDFHGNPTGEKVCYCTSGTFISEGGREVYYAAPFNMIPEPAGITVEIYRGSQLVVSVSRDKEDKPIAVEKDRLTNVLIELKGLVEVSVSVTEWGNRQVWKEF